MNEDTTNSLDFENITPEWFEKLPDSEKTNEEIPRKSRTYLEDAWLRFKKNPLAMAGLLTLVIVVLFAIFGPIFSPYDYMTNDVAGSNQGPSIAHWFGTDKFGRDIFVRCMYGARISLSIGFCAAAINLIIGTLYGGISGFFGGKIDLVMQRIAEIIYGIPQICYVILIMMFFGNTITSILLAICVTYWIGTARVVRSEILTLKNQDFVMAARVIGESDFRIIVKHLLPNCLSSIIVTVTFLIPQAIFLEAFLSFLGIGIQLPQASWGTLANDAIAVLFTYPYQMLFPALLISITMFAFNFIGDGLRDALDPKLKD